MRIHRYGIALLCAVANSACATLPTLPTHRGIVVNDIVDATKCELASIMANPKYAKEMKDWSAKVSLDLRVLYDNSGGPGATLIVPYHSGTVDMSAELAASAQSNRVGHLAYNVAKLGDLVVGPCNPSTGIPYAPGGPGLEGLGLGEWLEQAVMSVTRGVDFVDLDELTYTLEFVVERSATGDIRIRSTAGPTTGTAGLGGKASAKDSNTLLVSLVPPPQKPRPAKIAIVSWPALPKGVTVVPDPAVGAPISTTPKIAGTPRSGGQAQTGAQTRTRRPQSLDADTQQRLDNLQVRQRLFNSITIPRSNLNTF